MKKTTTYLVAALFAASTVSAFAASEKDAAKPTAEQCKKDPKMKGCEDTMKKKS